MLLAGEFCTVKKPGAMVVISVAETIRISSDVR